MSAVSNVSSRSRVRYGILVVQTQLNQWLRSRVHYGILVFQTQLN